MCIKWLLLTAVTTYTDRINQMAFLTQAQGSLC
jgi:hypothetical protein